MTDDRILATRLRDALPLFSALAMCLITAVIVVTLYAGREVFVPLALAILLSFVLAPVVRLLQRIGAPRVAAVMAVVLVAFAAIFGLGTVFVGQITQLAAELPRYQSTMREKIKSVRGIASESGPLGRAADILQDLEKQIQGTAPEQNRRTSSTGPLQPADKPVPIEVREAGGGPLSVIGSLAATLLSPLATTGIIVVFVIFILMQREDLRNRFIRLAGAHDLQKTTAALDDAAERLSRLLLTQLALNTTFGIAIGVGLWFIGIPSAILWGILGAILRFVPYVGAVIAAAFPLALAVAVDPGWSMLFWTAALFLVVESVIGQIIEPFVAGHSTGLSPVAVVLAATFWTVLWGPIGLVLATPLTVCLVIIGHNTERLRFIGVLLSNEPALSPPQIFYQRMLAGDPVEAVDQAEDQLKDASLASYYDKVALPGLRLAHEDVARGSLDRERQETIRSTVKELIAELEAIKPDPAADAEKEGEGVQLLRAVPELRPEWAGEMPVVCIAGRDVLDESAALLLGQLLARYGLKTQIFGAQGPAAENLPRLERGVGLIFVSFMDAPSPAHIRYAVRRARRMAADAAVVVGVWRGRDTETVENLRRQNLADAFVTSFGEALKTTVEFATQFRGNTPIDPHKSCRSGQPGSV